MGKSSSRRKSRKLLFIALGASVVLAFGYLLLRPYLTPTPADIFVIDAPILQPGRTTISGTLIKETSSGGKDSFLLTNQYSQVILLDLEGLDSLLGNVSVKGILVPGFSELDTPYMVVESISSESPQ